MLFTRHNQSRSKSNTYQNLYDQFLMLIWRCRFNKANFFLNWHFKHWNMIYSCLTIFQVRIHNFLEKTKKFKKKNAMDDAQESVSVEKNILRKRVNTLIKRKRLIEVQNLVKNEEMKPWGRDKQAKVCGPFLLLLDYRIFFPPPKPVSIIYLQCFYIARKSSSWAVDWNSICAISGWPIRWLSSWYSTCIYAQI